VAFCGMPFLARPHSWHGRAARALVGWTLISSGSCARVCPPMRCSGPLQAGEGSRFDGVALAAGAGLLASSDAARLREAAWRPEGVALWRAATDTLEERVRMARPTSPALSPSTTGVPDVPALPAHPFPCPISSPAVDIAPMECVNRAGHSRREGRVGGHRRVKRGTAP